MKERGVDGDLRRELVGHSKGKGDVHDTVYDQAEFNPSKAFAAISSVDFALTHPAFVDTEPMKKCNDLVKFCSSVNLGGVEHDEHGHGRRNQAMDSQA